MTEEPAKSVDDFLIAKGLAYEWLENGDRYDVDRPMNYSQRYAEELQKAQKRAFKFVRLHRLQNRNNCQERDYKNFRRKFERDVERDPLDVIAELEKNIEVLGDLKQIMW